MKPLTKKWLDQASYDLKTAEAMLKARRYLYVAFMCQQAVEKLLKGIFCERKDETPPYTHRLVTLVRLIEIQANQDRLDFLDLLTTHYIGARYPEYKQKLARNFSNQKADSFFRKTKEVFQWLKKESGI